jgi:hypothetical protein
VMYVSTARPEKGDRFRSPVKALRVGKSTPAAVGVPANSPVINF